LVTKNPKEVMYVVNSYTKPVQRLLEEADMIGLRRTNKSSRLVVVDGL
jgi:hypothetical protein